MKKFYRPTELEKWIATKLIRIGITRPEQINEQAIAQAFNIFYKKAIMAHSIEQGKFRLICVSESKNKYEQREEFYHELCHILRHAGRQIMMPKAFRELQEWDANRFTLYAAIPIHMLKYIDFHDPNIIENMSEIFGVTQKLCHDRLTRIYNNIHIVNIE